MDNPRENYDRLFNSTWKTAGTVQEPIELQRLEIMLKLAAELRLSHPAVFTQPDYGSSIGKGLNAIADAIRDFTFHWRNKR